MLIMIVGAIVASFWLLNLAFSNSILRRQGRLAHNLRIMQIQLIIIRLKEQPIKQSVKLAPNYKRYGKTYLRFYYAIMDVSLWAFKESLPIGSELRKAKVVIWFTSIKGKSFLSVTVHNKFSHNGMVLRLWDKLARVRMKWENGEMIIIPTKNEPFPPLWSNSKENNQQPNTNTNKVVKRWLLLSIP